MLYAIVILGGIGVLFGIILGFVNKKFSIEEDPRQEAILEALPGANCGACGYPGCSGCADAIFTEKAPINACPVGGAPVADAISKILGIKADTVIPQIARCRCNGSTGNAKRLYDYQGAESCLVAKTIFSGSKLCDYGCLGLGSCATACPFDAILMEDGLPTVNPKKCTSCGICVTTCPQVLMQLVPKAQTVFVDCHNLIKGKKVLEGCSVGCIKCKKCEKACQYDAIHVTDVARIDYSKCTNCGDCVTACPTHTIVASAIISGNIEEKNEILTSCGGCTACQGNENKH